MWPQFKASYLLVSCTVQVELKPWTYRAWEHSVEARTPLSESALGANFTIGSPSSETIEQASGGSKVARVSRFTRLSEIVNGFKVQCKSQG